LDGMPVPELVVSGSIAVDRIMNFSGTYKDLIHPEKLHVLSISIFLDKLEDTEGGIAPNICYGLAQLGDEPVLYGSVGKDAEAYMERLKRAGINTDYLHYSRLKTATFNVMTDDDNNQVGGFYPGAMADAGTLSLERWKGSEVIVCVSAHDPKAMRMQTDQCREFGLRLFYDPGQQVTNAPAEDLAAGIEAAEVVIANDYEIGQLVKKTGISDVKLKQKTPIVITTLGHEGSVIEGSKVPKPIRIKATEVKKVIDPTGTGDAYRAGFLHGYIRGWDLRMCGQLGSVIASFILEHHGTQVKLDKDEVIKRYKKTYKQEVQLEWQVTTTR
jgi:adenosine kinase